MPFPFVYVCDLLDKLEGICVREVPLLRKDRVSQTKSSIVSWFTTHRWRINAHDTHSIAVLMMLKPERHTDREYGVKRYMEQILARIFKMPTPMYEKLTRWKDEAHNHGDLGSRLCQVMQDMKATPSSATASRISVEEINQSLLRIAIFNDGSSSAVKSLRERNEKPPDRIEVLERLYTQLQPREAKWLTRIILKNYGPVTLPDSFPLPGNVTHLPNSLSATFQFPSEPPIPERWTGLRIKKGTASKHLAHPLPTPPTSSPHLPNSPNSPPPEPAAVAEKPAPRYRIAWNPESCTLSAPVKVTAPTTLAKSSPLPQPPTNALLMRNAVGQIPPNISLGTQSQQSQSRSQENILNISVLGSVSIKSQRQTSTHPIMFSTGKCLLTRHHCQFSSALLILSPCLLSNTYLLTTLIPQHGAHHLPSLASLSHPSIPLRTKSGRRVRKFILVDITRPEQTLLFCKQAEKVIGKLGWKTRSGRVERIPIFDWKFLESFAKLHRSVALGFDPVGKHFQGTI